MNPYIPILSFYLFLINLSDFVFKNKLKVLFI